MFCKTDTTQKRKTRCNGPPSPCTACRKIGAHCHFNLKLDARRRNAYKPSVVHQHQQEILNGILLVLRHDESKDVEELLRLIRVRNRPEEVVQCLRKAFERLQERRILNTPNFEEVDILSLGLQPLFSHLGETSSNIPVESDVVVARDTYEDSSSLLSIVSEGFSPDAKAWNTRHDDKSPSVADPWTTFQHLSQHSDFVRMLECWMASGGPHAAHVRSFYGAPSYNRGLGMSEGRAVFPTPHMISEPASASTESNHSTYPEPDHAFTSYESSSLPLPAFMSGHPKPSSLNPWDPPSFPYSNNAAWLLPSNPTSVT